MRPSLTRPAPTAATTPARDPRSRTRERRPSGPATGTRRRGRHGGDRRGVPDSVLTPAGGDELRLRDLGVGQAVVAAVVGVRELAVVEAQGVEQGGLEVVDGDDVLDGGVAEVVGRAVDVAPLEAAAGQPEREAVAVVVAAVGPLRDRQAAELAGPEDDGRSSSPRCFRSWTSAALGWSVRAQSPLRVSAFLLWVSQGWPLRKSWTNRTPRSTSRRASRQRVPYSRRRRVVQAVQPAGRSRARSTGRGPRGRPSASARRSRSWRSGPPARCRRGAGAGGRGSARRGTGAGRRGPRA